ncbi:MAG: amidohydrolase [Candidatus Bathyarchaeota archaeon]|nr:amidohydrolase [Candidatus Bathyarchaeota archaeon]
MASNSEINKLALTNGNVITIDERNPRAQAVYIVGERIVKVGSDGEIGGLIDEATDVIDLEGRTVVPGFVDCHAHPMGFGQSLMNVNCCTPPMRSIEDIVESIREAVEEKGEGEWILGRGYDDFKLAEKRHPNRWDLDSAAPDNPVIITRLCGHISVVNSLALELVGITKDTKDLEGGEIDRDTETGEPTGVLRGGAIAPIRGIIPPPDLEKLKRGIELAAEEFLTRGVTSVSDAGVRDPLTVKAYQAVMRDGMPIRVNLMMSREVLDHLSELGVETGFGDERLRIGAIKMVFDGSFSGRTAAMFEPFKDTPGNTGILYTSQEELNEGVLASHEAGFQVGVHAIGDRAISGVLDAYEAALKRLPKADHRFRIEHCGINSPEIVLRIKSLGVIPVPQPIFLWGEGESYRAGLDGERADWAYPVKTWMDEGITVALSSDCPATSGEELISPLLGIHVAANRKTDAGNDIGPAQRIGVENAIRAYTLNGAIATFEEGIKGSIEPGKLADLVVLSEDPTEVTPGAIKDVGLEMTIVGGRIAYRKRIQLS